jgi:hypothetical protein
MRRLAQTDDLGALKQRLQGLKVIEAIARIDATDRNGVVAKPANIIQLARDRSSHCIPPSIRDCPNQRPGLDTDVRTIADVTPTAGVCG